jgi:short-subunit dehydrogenase
MIKDLRGTNAILTGASRGLGVLIAHALADEGVNLALAARSADALERVRADIAAKGVRAVAVPTDVADQAQQDALLATAEGELGPIDILVNNAGLEGIHRFEDYPVEEMVKLLDVNLTAPLLLTRKVLPGMLERGRGHIVQISSLAGKGGFPCDGPYAASKAGLIMFTHSLRAELADSPVGTSVICPGFVADEGMYADMVRGTSIEASKLLGVSKPEKVAEAVIKAIKRGSAELIVNPMPMRPVLTLSQIAPDAAAGVLKTLGVTRLARRVADAQTRAPQSEQPRSE